MFDYPGEKTMMIQRWKIGMSVVIVLVDDNDEKENCNEKKLNCYFKYWFYWLHGVIRKVAEENVLFWQLHRLLGLFVIENKVFIINGGISKMCKCNNS